MQVLPMTKCAVRSDPPCGKRAAVVFTLRGGNRSFHLERCEDHAELMRAALQSLLVEGAWREEPLVQTATEL